MSTPISPIQLSVYKIIREYERTGKTIFYKYDVLKFSKKAIQVASLIDKEDYWGFYHGEEILNFNKSLSKICNVTPSFLEVNKSKLENGGKKWAEKIIGVMPYSFLKSALQVLNEELKEKEETKEIL